MHAVAFSICACTAKATSCVCYLPLHTGSAERVHAYLEMAGHGETPNAPLFQPARKTLAALTADGVYKIVLADATGAQIDIQGFGCIVSERRQRPTHWNMKPILPRFRNGLGTPTLPRYGYTIAVGVARKTPQDFVLLISNTICTDHKRSIVCLNATIRQLMHTTPAKN
ncbi:hypothetical protein BHUM_01048c [Candidatus Burkholderia humilis]|nr:hypothetical protein BHUM_01048c [Candidatus Burkholderia humilis]